MAVKMHKIVFSELYLLIFELLSTGCDAQYPRQMTYVMHFGGHIE